MAHGHDHLFAKQDLDGVVYQVVPQPAHARYGNVRSAEASGYVHGDVLAGSGHLRVMVFQGKVEVEYVSSCLPRDESDGRQNGAAVYAYTILAD